MVRIKDWSKATDAQLLSYMMKHKKIPLLQGRYWRDPRLFKLAVTSGVEFNDEISLLELKYSMPTQNTTCKGLMVFNRVPWGIPYSNIIRHFCDHGDYNACNICRRMPIRALTVYDAIRIYGIPMVAENLGKLPDTPEEIAHVVLVNWNEFRHHIDRTSISSITIHKDKN